MACSLHAMCSLVQEVRQPTVSHAWCRYGHVQLAAWTSSTEKTVIAAADAPDALPELRREASDGAASKGSQQVTGWQVRPHFKRQFRTHCLQAVAGASA